MDFINFDDVARFQTWLIWISLTGMLISMIGFTLIAKGLQHGVRQQQANVFIEYTKRYSELCKGDYLLISSFPNNQNPDASEIRTYENFLPSLLSLIHQEFFLWRQGMISNDIWLLWLGYFENDAKTPQFKAVWAKQKSINAEDRAFVQLIDRMIK